MTKPTSENTTPTSATAIAPRFPVGNVPGSANTSRFQWRSANSTGIAESSSPALRGSDAAFLGRSAIVGEPDSARSRRM